MKKEKEEVKLETGGKVDQKLKQEEIENGKAIAEMTSEVRGIENLVVMIYFEKSDQLDLPHLSEVSVKKIILK